MSFFAVSVSRKLTSPLRQKPRLFTVVSMFIGANEEEEWVLGDGCQLISCTWGADKEEESFT